MDVARSNLGILVTQQKYVLDLLQVTWMIGCKSADTVMDPNTKLGLQIDGIKVDQRRYHFLVGKLIYITHTQPDVSFVASVSQFLNNSSEEHMNVVYWIRRYLKGTTRKWLILRKSFSQGSKSLHRCRLGRLSHCGRSTSGYCSYIWENLVSWRSK